MIKVYEVYKVGVDGSNYTYGTLHQPGWCRPVCLTRLVWADVFLRNGEEKWQTTSFRYWMRTRTKISGVFGASIVAGGTVTEPRRVTAWRMV